MLASTGPSTEPWRTPQATLNHSPSLPSERTLQRVLEYESRRSLTDFLGSPRFRRALHNRRLGIRSKHCSKSIKSTNSPSGSVPADSMSRCKMLRLWIRPLKGRNPYWWSSRTASSTQINLVIRMYMKHLPCSVCNDIILN